MLSRQYGLPFEGHGIGNETPSNRKCLPHLREDVFAGETATNENDVRPVQRRQGLWRTAFNNL